MSTARPKTFTVVDSTPELEIASSSVDAELAAAVAAADVQAADVQAAQVEAAQVEAAQVEAVADEDDVHADDAVEGVVGGARSRSPAQEPERAQECRVGQLSGEAAEEKQRQPGGPGLAGQHSPGGDIGMDPALTRAHKPESEPMREQEVMGIDGGTAAVSVDQEPQGPQEEQEEQQQQEEQGQQQRQQVEQHARHSPPELPPLHAPYPLRVADQQPQPAQHHQHHQHHQQHQQHHHQQPWQPPALSPPAPPKRQPTEELAVLAAELRRSVNICDRKYRGRVFEACFIGSEAVDSLMAAGRAESRGAATVLGERLASAGHLRHVTNGHAFKDAALFYQFAADDDSIASAVREGFDVASAGAAAVSAAHAAAAADAAADAASAASMPAGAPASVAPAADDGTTTASVGGGAGRGHNSWYFEPHTIHNSIALDVALAEELVDALGGSEAARQRRSSSAGTAADSRKLNAVRRLRHRVLEAASLRNRAWKLVQDKHVNGTRVKRFARDSDGNFKTRMNVGTLAMSAKEFVDRLVDFRPGGRKSLDPTFNDGVVVERVEGVGGEFNDGYTAAAGNLVNQELRVSAARASAAGSGLGSEMAPSTDAKGADVAAGTPADAGKPPVAPVAAAPVAAAPVAAGTTSAAAQRALPTPAHTSEPAQQHRSRGLPKTARCKQCNQVVARTVEAIESHSEVCPGGAGGSGVEPASPHSPRSPRTPTGSSPATGSRSLLGRLRRKASFRERERRDREAAAMAQVHAQQRLGRLEAQEQAADGGAGVPRPGSSSCAGAASPMMGGSPALTSTSGGGGGDGSMPPLSLVKSVGGVVKHESWEGEAFAAGGVRLIYRTLESPMLSLMSPRDVCALQDRFVDSKTGTHAMYEISIVHPLVRGTRGHVRAEVLLEAFIVQPVPSHAHVSTLVHVTQMDFKGSYIGRPVTNKLLHKRLSGAFAFEAVPSLRLAEAQEQARQQAKLPKGRLQESDAFEGIPAEASFHAQNDPAALAAAMAAAATGGGSGGSGGAGLEGRPESVDLGTESSRSACLTDFELLAVLGRGGFGKVMQVLHISSGKVYAMKVLRKTDLIKRKQVERTKTERQILAVCTHPYIVKMHFAFQTPQKLYMVMDFVQGGDFFTYLRREGHLVEERVRLYVAEIALALHHLHERGIVYRDLKPENVLLDHEGHIKLVDFGLSRHFESRPPGAAKHGVPLLAPGASAALEESELVTHSFCGTEHYMAPEMLLQQGHGKAVDWWCLGILACEMLQGRHPFDGGNHYQTLRNMVTQDPVLHHSLSPASRSVVKGLLRREQHRRLGAGAGGLEKLQAHPFFLGLNWEKLMRREVQPAYRPNIASVHDVGHFERTFTREQAIDSTVGERGNNADDGGFFNIFQFFSGKSSPTPPEGATGDGKGAGRKVGRKADDVFADFTYEAPSALAQVRDDSVAE